jgi:choice-of-anchor B domain-containing protein
MMEVKNNLWTSLDAFTDTSTGSNLCVDGYAGEYECSNIDLLSHVSLPLLGCSGIGNDLWGWVDGDIEIVIAGCSSGSSFVDVSDPYNPVVLGFLDTATNSSSWRDIKVYNGYAFIGSEANAHGIQIINLSEVSAIASEYRYNLTHGIINAPTTGYALLNYSFTATAHYTGVGNIY